MTETPAAPDGTAGPTRPATSHLPEFAIVSTMLLIAAPILLVSGTLLAAFNKRLKKR